VINPRSYESSLTIRCAICPGGDDDQVSVGADWPHPSVPARNVASLIGLAKANPGTLNFLRRDRISVIWAWSCWRSRPGSSSSTCPRGVAPATMALARGRRAGSCTTTLRPPRARARGQDGRARGRRSPALPALARYSRDRGDYPGFEFAAWVGIFAPRNSEGDRRRISRETPRFSGPDVLKIFSSSRSSLSRLIRATISFGVFAGAKMPTHAANSNPG